MRMCMAVVSVVLAAVAVVIAVVVASDTPQDERPPVCTLKYGGPWEDCDR